MKRSVYIMVLAVTVLAFFVVVIAVVDIVLLNIGRPCLWNYLTHV